MAWHYDLVIANLLYNTLSMHQNGYFEGGEVGWITHIIMEVFVYSLIKGLAHAPLMVADAIARSLIDKEIVYPWRRPPKDPMGPDYESFLHRTYRENLHFTYCGDLLLSLKYRSILLLLSDHWMKSKTRLILINANQDEILSRVFLIPDLETSTITVDPGNYLFHIETTEEDRFVIEKALQTLLINPVSGQISEVYVPRITKTRKEKTKRVWMPLKESPPDEDRIIID